MAPAEFERIEGRIRPNVQSVSYGMPQAAFKFHNLIQQGLLADARVRILSVVGRPVSAKFHSGLWWKTTRETLGPRHHVIHPGFPNLMGVKQLVIAVRMAVVALLWRVRTSRSGVRIVIVDGAYVTGLPILLATLSGANLSRVGIFSDIYSYMENVDDGSGRRVSRSMRVLRRLHARNVAQLDAFVVLTEEMAEVLLASDDRPHVVIEGMVDAALESDPGVPVERSDNPQILYAGAVRREYGVEDLVEATRALDIPELQLVIYGAGDYAEDLAQEASLDARIDFRGAAGMDEVLLNERKAWLLVNPRPADQEFTRFSFPSKNMEYLASGTAMLTTRLPGMPAEYYDYVLTVDGSGPVAMAEALRTAIGRGLPDLETRGRLGRAFVLQRKNNRVQAARILRMVGVPAPKGKESV